MKSKNLTWVSLVALIVLGAGAMYPSVSFAEKGEGTGVGNGGGSARDEYLSRLKAELAEQGERGSDEAELLSEWCSRVSSILVREKQRAMLQYQYGHKAQAEQILNDALVAAAQSVNVNPHFGGPMAKKLIDRALMESAALDDSLPGNTGIVVATKLNFLFGAVDFIVDVSRDLDPTYYIPYRYRHHGCYRDCPPEFDFAAFEAAFARVVARQLTFATEKLTESQYSSGGAQIYPLGSPKAFLKVAELTTGFVARDLKQNLHAYSLSCAIRELEALSDELSAYNVSGDHTVFPNDPWAVSQSARTMNRIADQIRDLSGCGRN